MTDTRVFADDEIDTTIWKEFPTYYTMNEIGHNVALVDRTPDLKAGETLNQPAVIHRLTKPGGKSTRLFQVTNRKIVTGLEQSVASSSLPAAAASFDLGDISDWLETDDLTFYNLLIGFWADKYTEWQVRLPQSVAWGGIKNTNTVRFTQDESPYKNPRLNIVTYQETQIPSFKVFNQSVFTLTFAKLRAIGFKYDIQPLATVPMMANGKPEPITWHILGDVQAQ